MTTDAGGMRRQRRLAPGVVLFLHNRYRTTGGEERVVDDLLWLVREHLREDAELLTRDSATLGRARPPTARAPCGGRRSASRATRRRSAAPAPPRRCSPAA